MKLNLNQKILAGFIGCTLILISVAIFSFRNSEKFVDSNAWVDHTNQVLHEFEQVLAGSVDAETGARGFVITGDESYLEPYNIANTTMFEHLRTLKELTKDNPVQQKNVDELEDELRAHVAHLDLKIRLRKKSFEEAKALVLSGEGKRIEDKIRKRVANATKIEQSLLEERRKASEEDARNFNLIFIILLVVIAIVLISVYLIINTNLRALKKAEAESDNKNWLLTGNFELNETCRGEREEMELAQSIIDKVCSYLKAQIGVIYLSDNGMLKQAGSYAFHVRKQNASLIRIGEGLVGQAAREKKAIIFTEVPDDYIKINSGLGNITPKNLVILPLLLDGNLKGVLEIGTVRSLTELEMEFLNMISENLAIVLNAAQSRSKLKELLEETQRQSEELETQQEELKQSNEELQEKTRLLEKSEGMLKAQQEELQQTNEELEEKANLLEQQKEKLENAKVEVEAKARELEITGKYKSEFLANMSHELRTPLNSILILAQLLSENKSKSLSAKEVEFSKNIYNSGADLLNLINEILDLSKVESGKIELDIAEISLPEIRSEMSSMFTELAKKKSIEFALDFPEALSGKPLRTDKQRLEQILRNLLSNAFKFTASGGRVSLSVRQADQATEFRNKNLRRASDILAFSVNDTGIGIPKDKQEIVFEAFQQADGSTKRKYGGTGLGLSISRELANALGGEISLQSEEGKGSVFTLYIPLQFDPSFVTPAEKKVEVKQRNAEIPNKIEKFDMPASDTSDDRYAVHENSKTILIMEDDPDFANYLLQFVRDRGYKGIIALQGNTGLSLARHYKPDAIMLDMKLPVMDGTEVLKHLKNDPDLRHIPVQIISGYDTRREGMELGAFDFIRKPISQADLQNVFGRIEEFMNRKLKKLLVIEDDETQNKAIRELIGNGDVKSFSAFSGKEAYEMMQKDRFDCVIVDLGLPDMTGFELLEKIKSDSKLSKIPVVVYTGKNLSVEENNRLNRLADAVVLKTANSQERLLDETILFLHRVESNLPKEKQSIIRKLHKTDEVLRGKKILLVDDDIRNIYSLANVLEEEGMQCLTAENGRAAVNMLRENNEIDIILMDVMMPEMDGYEATRMIRKMSNYGKVPIIALTAKAMKGDREKCLDAGMSDYVSKPLKIEQLLSLMRVWLYK
jgi:CheY-like chemotaxis protein/CHASE3 domain sensor protein